MNEVMKYGYNICGQRINDEIDTMIEEIQIGRASCRERV